MARIEDATDVIPVLDAVIAKLQEGTRPARKKEERRFFTPSEETRELARLEGLRKPTQAEMEALKEEAEKTRLSDLAIVRDVHDEGRKQLEEWKRTPEELRLSIPGRAETYIKAVTDLPGLAEIEAGLVKRRGYLWPGSGDELKLATLREQKARRLKPIPVARPAVEIVPIKESFVEQLMPERERIRAIEGPRAVRKVQGTTCQCVSFTDESRQKMAKMLACEDPDEPGRRKRCVERIAPINVEDSKYVLGKSHIGGLGDIKLSRLDETWAGIEKDEATQELRGQVESLYKGQLIGGQGVFGTALGQRENADRLTAADIMEMLFHKPDCYCKGKRSTEGEFIREEALCWSSDVGLGAEKLFGELAPAPAWLAARPRPHETPEEAEKRAKRAESLTYPIFTPSEGERSVMEMPLFDAVRLFPSAIVAKYGGDVGGLREKATTTEKAIARVLVESLNIVKRRWVEPHFEGGRLYPPRADEMQPCRIQLGYHRRQRQEKVVGVEQEPLLKVEEPTPEELREIARQEAAA